MACGGGENRKVRVRGEGRWVSRGGGSLGASSGKMGDQDRKVLGSEGTRGSSAPEKLRNAVHKGSGGCGKRAFSGEIVRGEEPSRKTASYFEHIGRGIRGEQRGRNKGVQGNTSIRSRRW